MRIHLPNDFTPRDYQRRYMRWFDTGGKRAVWVVHRRGGKDLTGAHQLVKMAHERIAAYWHVFPTFEQGRKAIWEGFRADGKRTIDNVFPAEIIKRRDNQQMMIELKCGSIYRIIGSDKIEVVGAGPAGVLFSEYSIAKPKAWDLISPMLRENDGWASFVYTPRGNNHGKKLFDMARKNAGWFCELQTLYDTRAYDPDLTIAEERAAGRPEAMIRQEYLCDWTAANVGSVWGEQMEALEKSGRLETFEHPNDGVYTTWDLGVSDATAIWFWRINDKRAPDLIDHYEATGQPASHYFDELETRGYSYVKHWLPPTDGPARTWQTGVANIQLLIDWCKQDENRRGAVTIAPNLGLPDGIQAARWLLQQPIRIHSRCGEGIEALKSYHYVWDEDLKVFSNKPEHDWSSHSADAFRYVACVVKRTEQFTRPVPQGQSPVAVPLSGSFDLEQLFEDRSRDSGGTYVPCEDGKRVR